MLHADDCVHVMLGATGFGSSFEGRLEGGILGRIYVQGDDSLVRIATALRKVSSFVKFVKLLQRIDMS